MKQGVKHDIKIEGSYYLTLTVESWLDVFTRLNHKNAIIESLDYCIKNKGLNVFAYCLMTNHLHMIVNSQPKFLLKDTLRDFKKYTAKRILDQITNEPESRRDWMLAIFTTAAYNSTQHKTFKFWKAGNHAIELYSEKFVWEKINYIHENPVRAGFVSNIQDWKYSSATNYMEMESVLKNVERLPQRLITYR